MSSGCRFGVCDIEGNRSSVYRLWRGARSSDVYIAARSVAGELKASLHQTGQAHVALTSERVDRRGPGPTLEAGRYFDKWRRLKADASPVRAFTVYFPTSELTPPAVEAIAKPVVWLPAASSGCALAVEVFFVPDAMSEASWQTPEGAPMHVMLRMPLPSGETLCAVTREVHIKPGVYEQLEHVRARARDDAELALPAEQWNRATSTMRYILIGADDDGSRFFVDAAMPPAG